eukprot:CAMPEP_0174284972 /NCGR_PEP_ID=MMETSP0809-20121228/7454_1 /TAXON_ID=73025 ORGANISM="Eutreptiella gymnastica-like, Strain CCMP1594" /NCGR_SAMPLE_ID=MMETSP0809 /ASSEMBLY_ACC=CAM_ASM_000658 /LENGTH=47 /DNA_ID= /DNA_START= /DNA_END= /DNA_ORIENTATION=
MQECQTRYETGSCAKNKILANGGKDTKNNFWQCMHECMSAMLKDSDI